MRTIRLVIEYDGTDFAGWQFQPNGTSVQQVVEEALARHLGAPVRLYSSGRTDAGVHARGMVAHFETDRQLPFGAYREGVNRLLPDSVAIVSAEEAEPGFHARFSAKGKWYRYTICNRPVRSPLAGRFCWHIRRSLDTEAMVLAARILVGEHDFSAFRTSGCNAKTTKRLIFSVQVTAEGELLHIDVRGSGFLRNMVRILAGTLVEVGLGKRSVDSVQRLLQGDSGDSGQTAPASGLCLMEVWY